MNDNVRAINRSGTPAALLADIQEDVPRMTNIIVAYTVRDENGDEMIRTAWSRQTFGDILWSLEILRDEAKGSRR